MEARILEINYLKPYQSPHGPMHDWHIKYEGGEGEGMYTSKANPQTFFKVGEVASFTEDIMFSKQGKRWAKIKPIRENGNRNYSGFRRELKKEQSKYSGFAMSYAKDLCVAGQIKYENIFIHAQQMMDWMVEQDAKLANN